VIISAGLATRTEAGEAKLQVGSFLIGKATSKYFMKKDSRRDESRLKEISVQRCPFIDMHFIYM